MRMRILPQLYRGFLFLCVVCAAAPAFGCDQLAAGQTLWIRLAAPVSTYTAKVGDPVRAVLTQDVACNNDVLIPMGSPVEGIVRSKRKVGWGIRHETAALELEFNQATVNPGITLLFTARVEEVENARERVRNGVIQGIRSSDTIQGSINRRLIHLPTWNPYSYPVLMAYKATFPIFPEPEIYYPAGTDIRLRTTTDISSAPQKDDAEYESSSAAKLEADRLDQLVAQLPWRVTTKKNADADVLNLVFIGSVEQVKSAFREAGWHNADSVSMHAWLKNLYALLNNSGYTEQPMTIFLLNGKPEDMNWQKDLNSYDRRDHLRIWESPSQQAGGSVWVASSTRDTRAVLAVKQRAFVHHIASDIDEERSTVIRDLNFAGCVQSVRYVSRPEVPTITFNSIGDIVHTDGSTAVITLQDCRPARPQLELNSSGGRFRPGNYAFRYIRRQILTFKSDIWRENIIYGAYDVGRMSVVALRRKPAIPQPPLQGKAISEPRASRGALAP